MDTDDVDDSPSAVRRFEWRVKVAFFVVGVMIVAAFLVIWFNILVNRYEVLVNRERLNDLSESPITDWQRQIQVQLEQLTTQWRELALHAEQLEKHERQLDQDAKVLDEHYEEGKARLWVLEKESAAMENKLEALERRCPQRRR